MTPAVVALCWLGGRLRLLGCRADWVSGARSTVGNREASEESRE
jgi:hypothetical protein